MKLPEDLTVKLNSTCAVIFTVGLVQIFYVIFIFIFYQGKQEVL